jgi:alkylmercury lyase
MSDLATTIELLQSRRGGDMPPATAEFVIAYTRLLARGKPVSAQALADELSEPVEFMVTALHQMQQTGAELNDKGELIGAALTLSPTNHLFVIDEAQLFAWCALDTLFLPAYIGKTAQVTSTCPITQKPISITIAPHGVEHIQPQETVLSIMTAPGCSAGIDGTFCSQVNFFASHEAATGWIGKRSDFSILSASDSYQLAWTIYIEPVMRHIRS